MRRAVSRGTRRHSPASGHLVPAGRGAARNRCATVITLCARIPTRGWDEAWAQRGTPCRRAAGFEGATRLLAVSRYLADVALRAGQTRLSVHYQGVDTRWWTPPVCPRERANLVPQGTTTSRRRGPTPELPIIFVGALQPPEGVDDLVCASSSLVESAARTA